MIQAAKFGQMEEATEAIELTEEEKNMEARLRVIMIDHSELLYVIELTLNWRRQDWTLNWSPQLSDSRKKSRNYVNI